MEYPARAEFKLDGSRLQIHKWGTQVWLFSRRAIEKSKTLPEIVEIAEKFNAHSCIIDGEVIAVNAYGRLLPFQSLLERTIPKEPPKVEKELRNEKIHVTIQVFDILFLNGRVLMDLPLSERRKYLIEAVPTEHLVEGRDC